MMKKTQRQYRAEQQGEQQEEEEKNIYTLLHIYFHQPSFMSCPFISPFRSCSLIKPAKALAYTTSKSLSIHIGSGSTSTRRDHVEEAPPLLRQKRETFAGLLLPPVDKALVGK
jgi:hypothetical protein